MPHSYVLVARMFSDKSNTLEIHVCKNEIDNSSKNTNLLAEQYVYTRGAFNKFPDVFCRAFVVDSLKFSMLLVYFLCDN